MYILRKIFLILLLSGTILPINFANSGDFARVEILGFSKNGQTFSFEEYGIQDGSGFPYSNIYLVGTKTDTWVSGSPFRKRFDNESENGLQNVRAANFAAASSLLSQKGIAGKGTTVGHNPVTELNANHYKMHVNPRLTVPPIVEPLLFTLTEIPLPNAQCASYGADTKGFKLSVQHKGHTKIINHDISIPNSRNCPLKYHIEQVITYYPPGKPASYAVLVLMQTHGFEGPNGRYIAVTGQYTP